jgi:hypothetical protein
MRIVSTGEYFQSREYHNPVHLNQLPTKKEVINDFKSFSAHRVAESARFG